MGYVVLCSDGALGLLRDVSLPSGESSDPPAALEPAGGQSGRGLRQGLK